ESIEIPRLPCAATGNLSVPICRCLAASLCKPGPSGVRPQVRARVPASLHEFKKLRVGDAAPSDGERRHNLSVRPFLVIKNETTASQGAGCAQLEFSSGQRDVAADLSVGVGFRG